MHGGELQEVEKETITLPCVTYSINLEFWSLMIAHCIAEVYGALVSHVYIVGLNCLMQHMTLQLLYFLCLKIIVAYVCVQSTSILSIIIFEQKGVVYH